MGKYVDSFQMFEAKYHTYTDYAKSGSKWGTTEELEKDALIKVKHIIPGDWDQVEKSIKSTEDQSDDKKGIKFEFKLKDGNTIHLFKTGRMRGDWEVFLNKKKMKDSATAYQTLLSKLPALEAYLISMKGFDSTYQYSDDNRAYKNGSAHEKALRQMYSKLSTSDKEKAYKSFKDRYNTTQDLNDFTGA